jgi:hypothetical protein
MSGRDFDTPLADSTWLYRGMPCESPEVDDVQAIGEVRPPRPDRIGEYYRQVHIHGDTETGYTSWTTDRSIAEAAAEDSSDNYNFSGLKVIFRVRVDSISEERIFPGRDDEDEFLIEGTVEEVSISESAADDEEEDHD